MSSSPDIKQFFDQIVAPLSEPVLLLSESGHIEAFNPAFDHLVGTSARDLIGQTLDTLVTQNARKEIASLLKSALESGSDTPSFKATLIDQANNEFITDLKISKIQLAGTTSALCILKNLEQSGANAQMRYQVELMDQAEQIAHLGHWRVDLDTDEVFWSKEIYNIHGVNPDQYSPELESAINFYHPDDIPLVTEHVERAIQDRSSFTFEARIVQPSGQIRYVSSAGEFNANGQSGSLIGIFQDITEQVESRLDLQNKNNFLTLMMESNPDLLFVKDRDFRIIRANSAFINVYPTEVRDRIIGYTTVENYSEEDAEAFLAHDKLAFEHGLDETEETLIFPDGNTRTLLTKKVRFEDGNGEPYILGIARDITKIKHAEQALKQANDELKEFAYRTSHDLRSPIVSTMSLLNMAKDCAASGDTETFSQALDLSISSLSKLDTLIKDLLTLTRARNLVEEDKSVNVIEEVNEALEKLAHMENFDRVSLIKDISFKGNILTKRSRFVLILENLVSNAIKYQDINESSSLIKISCHEQDGRIILSVEDNGIGVPEDQHSKMFQMFQRFHTKVSYGTGLGLYMIKKSADIIGAAIQFESLEKGSRFTINMPKN